MLNTVNDMHIYCNLRLQEIYGNRKKTVEPHLLDYYLNKAVSVYIESKIEGIKRGIDVDDNVKRLDDLKDLKSSIPLSLSILDNKQVYAYLPQDYLHFESGLVDVGCEIDVNISNNYYVTSFNLVKSSTISIDGVQILDLSQLPYGQTPNTDFIYINYMLSYFPYVTNDYIVECYYERFGDKYEKDKFIIVVYPKASIPSHVSVSSNTYYFDLIEGHKYNIVDDVKSKAIDLFKIHDIPDILTNEYHNRNRSNKPISYIKGDSIIIYNKDIYSIFYMNHLDLNYIKTPKLINHSTNTICEIKNRYEICDECIELIKSDIGDNTIQLTNYNNNKNV